MAKVAFIIPSLARAGGMEKVMSQIITYISGHKTDELHLVLFGPNNDKMFFAIPSNVTIHRPHFSYRNSKRYIYAIKSIIFVRKTIKNIEPDTILSFGEIWNSFVLISLLGLEYSIFISDRCRPNKSFGKIHDLLRKKLYPRATGIIAQTECAKSIYASQFHNDNIVVIGNPISKIDIFHSQVKENIVISVGRLIDTKNFDQLIDIFCDTDYADWKLIIVGGDALKQHNRIRLQQYIDTIGMNDRIILAGQRKNVDEYLLKSKIFAFTSSSEGFPNVIGEAMSAGLPVIAYDCIAGPSDMVEDGKNGYLIPLFDKKEFSRKLNSMMHDQRLINALGDYARESISKFDIDNIAEKYYNFIVQNIG